MPLFLNALIYLFWYRCVLTAMCACVHVWRPKVNLRYHTSGDILLIF